MNDNIVYDEKKNELTVCCTQCGHAETIKCSEQQWEDLYERKRLIQEIFPEVPADIREMFLSGWCGICYDISLTCLPKIEIEYLNQKAKEIFGDFLNEEFAIGDGDDIIDFITEMEWYDGIDNESPDMREQLKAFRDEVKKVLEKIWDEEENEDEDDDEIVSCDRCDWHGHKNELVCEWIEEANRYVLSCPKCGRGF